MRVSTIDIIITDGVVSLVDIQCTKDEAMSSLKALVEDVANGMAVHPSQILGALGKAICPDNCVIIQDKKEDNNV